jgi:hypothetical protein
MCQHTTLAKNSDGFVLWCKECLVYRMHFNSIVMVLDVKGLETFKSNLCNCYQENRFSQIDRAQKHLFFKTQVEGLQLFFSINDVGSLLALLQEAALSYSELNYSAS